MRKAFLCGEPRFSTVVRLFGDTLRVFSGSEEVWAMREWSERRFLVFCEFVFSCKKVNSGASWKAFSFLQSVEGAL